MTFLPVSLDLAKGPVVLFGTGAAAHAKLHLLRDAGAKVKWFSPEIEADRPLLHSPDGTGHVELVAGEPADDDLRGALALVCAASRAVATPLAARARALGVPVNVVDRLDLCTFIFPAMVNRDPVTIAIATGGAAPVLARRIRARIEAVLPARLGTLGSLMSRYRAAVVAARKSGSAFSTRRFWERVLDGPIGAAWLAGATAEAEAALAQAVAQPAAFSGREEGVVHLVGAGPGDPDLLTLRALDVLQDADIVFHDDLVPPEVLRRARRDAERVFVGKRLGRPGMSQGEINRRLVEAAQGGKRVVRLKSGDPFVFGRGGEELAHLRAAGVRTFVVPGITAALGCAAEAGLPLTFRDEATQLCLVTAHTTEGAHRIDWSPFAAADATIVVYMGLSAAAAVQAGLLTAGRDPATPAAVLVRGTQPQSQALVGRLDALAHLATQASEGPALVVVGQVVARCEAWRAAGARVAQAERV